MTLLPLYLVVDWPAFTVYVLYYRFVHTLLQLWIVVWIVILVVFCRVLLQKILFLMCAGNELFYCTLYLAYFTSGPEGLLTLQNCIMPFAILAISILSDVFDCYPMVCKGYIVYWFICLFVLLGHQIAGM